VPHAYGILDVVELEPDDAVDFLPNLSAPTSPTASSSSSSITSTSTTATTTTAAATAAAAAASASPFGPLGGSPTLQLVKLRNPNGHALWKGPWSYDAQGGRFESSDVRWTRARRQRLNVGEDDQGVFWMGWPEFCSYFAELTVCRLLDESNHLEARQVVMV